MKGITSLKNYAEFKRVYDRKKSYGTRCLVMYVAENDTGNVRIGISVSKKVGNSIVRHHITRLIRESYRLNKETVHENFRTGYDIIFVARPAAADKGYRDIEESMLYLVKKAKQDIPDRF